MSDTIQFQTYRVNILLKNGDKMHREFTQPRHPPMTINSLMSFQGGAWIGWVIKDSFFNKDFVVSVEIVEVRK